MKKKYEEEHYKYETIKEKIYPIIRSGFYDKKALNGKQLSEKDTVAISFLSDLIVLFAIQRGEESYEIMKDAMLPPEVSVEELYHTACSNLVRDVEYVIGNTWDGAYAIIADGMKEASALCLRHIWDVCTEKLKEDLMIMVPSAETVLFAPVGKESVLKKMAEHAEKSFQGDEMPISRQMFRYDKDNKELKIYEV